MTEKVCIIGSGNWGSCIAKIIGSNLNQLVIAERDRWQPTVNMWVYEETLPDGRLLSHVINTEHENVKSVISVLQTINTFASKVT
jgi:glycerol-3-phosphate dehydrogenase (NAD+)